MAVNYTIDGLKKLWTDNGGNPSYKNVAAYIAYAISKGNVDHSNGIWGVSKSGGDADQAARDAISKSNNGTNWTTWNVGSLQATALNLLSNLPGATQLETVRVNDLPSSVTPNSLIQTLLDKLGINNIGQNLLWLGLYLTLIPFGLFLMFIGFVIAWVGTGMPKEIATTAMGIVWGRPKAAQVSTTNNSSTTNILGLSSGPPPPDQPTQLLPVTSPPPPPKPAGWSYTPGTYGDRQTGALYMADDLFGEEAEWGVPDFALPRSLLGNMFNDRNASNAAGYQPKHEAEQAQWRSSRPEFWRNIAEQNPYREAKHRTPLHKGGDTGFGGLFDE